MKQEKNTEHEANNDKKLIEQYKNLCNFTHTEINNLYCLIDDLDKRIIQIQAQASYQSLYNLNTRLDKVERQQMQLPINYDDVVDIKNELKELKNQIKKEKTKTKKNSQKVEEISTQINYTLNDEPTVNDFQDLKHEVKQIKRHMNYYAPKAHQSFPEDSENKKFKKTRKSTQIKSKKDIPKPKKNNKDSLNITAEEQITKNSNQIKEIKSTIKDALDISNNTNNKIEEILSDIDQIKSHHHKIDTEIKHIHLKIHKLSKKMNFGQPCQEYQENVEKDTEKKDQESHKNSRKHKKHMIDSD